METATGSIQMAYIEDNINLDSRDKETHKRVRWWALAVNGWKNAVLK